MAQEIITLENLAAEIAKLRGELATWKALAIKQDRLNTAQMLAVNSGATAGKIAQIATNTSDIAALQQIASSAFRVVKVAQLPASGEPYIMYLVPQTDGETLNYCNEYLWIDNAWELVGTTGAMANNGELQIIVNGVTVGAFTANQATNSTASITVPTDTSQLTNGAGYVDATALATALASKQDSLSLAQLAAVNSGITSADVTQIGANTTAIAGKQDALTTSQLAAVNSGITSADVTQIGTNTGNIATNSAAIISLQGSKQNTLSAAQLLAVNSGITSSLVTQIGTNQSDITSLNTALGQSLTPSADNTYSLGGASFRYANVYAVTFTGDLTGTASKAIADEDGTSIKSGYVNVAGDQDVTGRKTFRGNAFFTSGVYHRNNSYEIGNTPASNITITHNFADKENNYTGFVRNVLYSAGRSATEVRARNLFKNGALDPTGSDISSNLNVEVQPNGDKTLYFDGSIRNNVLPYTTNTYALGSSSYQWSSVYAQSYYYNGTAWGLDKANVWTGNNTFTSTITTKTNVDRTVAPTSDSTYGTIVCRDKNGSAMFRMQGTIKTDLSNVWDMMMVAPNNSYITFFRYTISSSSSDRELRFKATSVIPDDNSTADLGSSSYQWSSVYAQTYFYNGTEFQSKFVTTDTSQSINSQKTFNANLVCTSSIYTRNGNYTSGTVPTSSMIAMNRFVDKNNLDIGYTRAVIRANGSTEAELRSLNRFTNGALDPDGSAISSSLVVGISSTGSTYVQFNGRLQNGLIPTITGSYDCGTSTNKWKTLNGINPGALSLPSSSYVDISGDITIRDGSAANNLTALCDGWISINSFATWIQISDDTTTMATIGKAGDDGFAQVFLPVRQGDSIRIAINQTGTNFQSFRLIPCLGNV